ncbi:MAG: hypothetical protein HQL58_01930 [Magnetococcales bacterium]|nr:hypothetical protein [Magnetococcales bacterium]
MKRSFGGEGEDGGFTLVELIVFIVIIASSIAAIVPLYTEVLIGQQQTREQIQAKFLATELFEQIRGECQIKHTTFANLKLLSAATDLTGFQRSMTITDDPTDSYCVNIVISVANSSGAVIYLLPAQQICADHLPITGSLKSCQK